MTETDLPPWRPRVLIADSYVASAVALKDFLLSHAAVQLRVHAVADGHAALAVAKATALDVAVLSEGLSTVSAETVAVALRHRRHDGRAVIAMVAADRQSAADARATGLYDAVLTRPIDVRWLLEVVQRAHKNANG